MREARCRRATAEATRRGSSEAHHRGTGIGHHPRRVQRDPRRSGLERDQRTVDGGHHLRRRRPTGDSPDPVTGLPDLPARLPVEVLPATSPSCRSTWPPSTARREPSPSRTRPDFCGVIQADAYVGPRGCPKRGFQHTIEDCEPPTTTTTTEPPTTTTTTSRRPPPRPPPSRRAATGLRNNTQPPAPTSGRRTGGRTRRHSTAAPLTQLPFTGRDIKPFLFGGLALVAVGLALLAPSEYWRRASRRLSAIFPRSSRWLSGTWMGRSALSVRLRGAASMVGCSFYGL